MDSLHPLSFPHSSPLPSLNCPSASFTLGPSCRLLLTGIVRSHFIGPGSYELGLSWRHSTVQHPLLAGLSWADLALTDSLTPAWTSALHIPRHDLSVSAWEITKSNTKEPPIGTFEGSDSIFFIPVSGREIGLKFWRISVCVHVCISWY